ncbi:BST1 [Scenedesmus sp. PABB004]|nr:BST1 [Scenedesmus sp. PABB004]
MRALAAAAALAGVVLLGALGGLLQRAQRCACEQTYMYSSYTPVPLADPAWAGHRYRLLLYRETSFARQALPPAGRPALLVPGNAGSFEQVRSLASQSARVVAAARRPGAGGPDGLADVDWYALDLRGELSAFDGALLEQQTAFALAALAQLADTYGPGRGAQTLPADVRPHSGGGAPGGGVLLVGHSMGGVIARAAAAAAWTHPALGPGSVALLLTLASPHEAPPLLLQPALARFYDGTGAARLPPGLPAVSVHGGGADMQVSPLLTRLPAWRPRSSAADGGSPAPARLSLSSEHIPGAWVAAGHTQIDWCNQLVTRLTAALVEVHAQQQQLAAHGRALLLLRDAREPHAAHTALPRPCAGSNASCAAAGAEAAPASQRVLRPLAALQALGSAPPGGGRSGAVCAVAALLWPGQALKLQCARRQPRELLRVAVGGAEQPGVGARTLLAAAGGESGSGGGSGAGSGESSSSESGGGGGGGAVPARAEAAAAAAGPLPHQAREAVASAVLSRFLVSRVAAALDGSAGARPPPALLLPATAPADATRRDVPPGEASVEASPAPAGSGGGGGSLLVWDAPAAAAGDAPGGAGADFVLLSSGAAPCTGFRVWLQRRGGAWADATGLAAPLPAVGDGLVSRVRAPGAWLAVMAGSDHLARAAWALALPHDTHLAGGGGGGGAPVARVAVWLAPATPPAAQEGAPGAPTPVPGTNVSTQALPAAAGLTAQWLPPRLRRPPLALGPGAALRPLVRPAGGAMLLRVRPRWRWLLDGLALRVRAAPARGGGGRGACWQPVAVFPGAWGAEQVAVLNTTAPAGAGGALGALRAAARPWLDARRKASAEPGSTAAAGAAVALAALAPGAELTLLLDPGCAFELALRWDVLGGAALTLLSHASAAAGMAVALLLLVLSHQMSALQRVVAAARHGGPPAPARPGGGAELRQASAGALQRLRARLQDTLGGAPPPDAVGAAAAGLRAAAAAAAAAAASRPGSRAGFVPQPEGALAGAGVSVRGSLAAVTADARVLGLAGLTAAAAAALSSASAARAACPARGAALTGTWPLLAAVGLAPRGASTGVVGAALLLGCALLCLLVAVGLSVGLKWGLDWCTAAVAALRRSLAPDGDALAAVAAASGAAPQGPPSETRLLLPEAAGAPARAAPARWWRRPRCQAQLAALLLLSAANIALGLACGVALLFLTWHLPSNSAAAASRVAELLLGSRPGSRAASRTGSPLPAARAGAAAAAAAGEPGRLASVAEGAGGWPAPRAPVRSDAGLLPGSDSGGDSDRSDDPDAPAGPAGGHARDAAAAGPAAEPRAVPAAAGAAGGQPHVAARHDAAAVRALALHQLSCHMVHAWALLYGSAALMLAPSLLAWARTPLGARALSHPADVALAAPLLAHITAMSAGTLDALGGPGAGGGGGARRGAVDLCKLVLRSAAGYMLAAALLGQAVAWLRVVACVACLMLGGRRAAAAWQRLHGGDDGGGGGGGGEGGGKEKGTPGTMRAVVMRSFGPPGALAVEDDFPQPPRRRGEVRIRVAAAGVNPIDFKTRKGDVPRLAVTLPKVLGGDVAGVVEEADAGGRFAPGDRVFGCTGTQAFWCTYGTYAEVVVAHESCLLPIPEGLSDEEAAAVPLAAMTAWQALAPAMPLAGKAVLVHAGAGGVGGFALQIAAAQRAAVVATTCSARNADYVRGLGATRPIDYASERFEAADVPAGGYDVVLDLMGGDYETRSLPLLRPGGLFAHVLNSGFVNQYGPARGAAVLAWHVAAGMLRGALGLGPRYRLTIMRHAAQHGLNEIAALLREGRLKVTVTALPGLESAARAHEELEGGHVRGKLVLSLASGAAK